MKLKAGDVEIEATPELAEQLKELFNCEIEMMQGEQVVLNDGRIKFNFNVDEEKGKLIASFITRVIASTVPMNLN